MNGKQLQVMQSKQRLVTALLQIMETKPFGDITVAEIVDVAQSSRRTFYRLFKNKLDLVDEYFSGLIDQYFADIQSQPGPSSFKETLVQFLHFWFKRRKALQTMIDNGLFERLLPLWSAQTATRYRTIDVPWHITDLAVDTSYVMAFSTGGFWNILNIWLRKQNPEEPEVIADSLVLALAALSQ